ncbi:hypothetical protein GCM10007388_27480 [Pseudoduganella plicata]|uniref:Nuclear transport factor 2 family protein n=2 Tax=Pseudoduganella plicata TaxID=321984 RepID=A0A4P7BM94_9BURK|nr:nuclear transport factor 2 family protein [Pseudoduganella plicata]GGY92601.1 hypothetical protein GCM10007388_27480 [Pseudoduganella plicata]
MVVSAASAHGTAEAAKQHAAAIENGNAIVVVKEFLENTAPDKVEAAARRLVAEDAVYISLNFDNPELKEIEPWTGTARGPQAFSSTFARVAKYWTIEDFTVTDMFGSGEHVAAFGSFTYRSVAVGTSFRSPFSIHAKVKDGKITYFQFMEDTYASASSFRQSGSWTVKTDPAAPAYEVGKAKR